MNVVIAGIWWCTWQRGFRWNSGNSIAFVIRHLVKVALTKTNCPREVGVLPYMCYIGLCGPKGCGISAVFVINKVGILADFSHLGHK